MKKNCASSWLITKAMSIRNFLYNVYRVFPGCKVRPGRAADHSLPSNAAVMEE